MIYDAGIEQRPRHAGLRDEPLVINAAQQGVVNPAVEIDIPPQGKENLACCYDCLFFYSCN